MASTTIKKYMDGTDSGWQELTDATKFTGKIYYRKIGNLVEISSNSLTLVDELTSASGITIATLPEGYRPAKLSVVVAGCTYDLVYARYNTNGNIGIFKNRNSASLPTDYPFYLATMFYTD